MGSRGCRNWETRNGVFNMWYRDDLNPNNSGMNQTPQDPVVCVRREDGREFAKWLSKKQVRPTVYQQKLSGNMRRVPERQQRIIGEMTLILTKLVNTQMY